MDVSCFLERADSEKLREAIYSLRYRSYRAVEAIPINDIESFSDKYDHVPNSASYLLKKNDGTAIGSIRACTYLPQLENTIPALEVFNEEIKNHLGLDKTIVESNRFTIDPIFQSHAMRYNINLFKAIYLHLILSNAGYVITAVRKNHVLFYKKTLKMYPISSEKIYPNLQCSMVLLAGDAKESCEYAAKNFPIIETKSKEIEEYQKCGIIRF